MGTGSNSANIASLVSDGNKMIKPLRDDLMVQQQLLR